MKQTLIAYSTAAMVGSAGGSQTLLRLWSSMSIHATASHHYLVNAGMVNLNHSWWPPRESVCLGCLTLGTAKPFVFLFY